MFSSGIEFRQSHRDPFHWILCHWISFSELIARIVTTRSHILQTSALDSEADRTQTSASEGQCDTLYRLKLRKMLHRRIWTVSLATAEWHIHTHSRLTALCPGLPGWAATRKVKPILILLKQETESGSGINWAICKSAPRSRQITTPAPLPCSSLQAGCSSWRPTNSIKALKAYNSRVTFKVIQSWEIVQFNSTCITSHTAGHKKESWWCKKATADKTSGLERLFS